MCCYVRMLGIGIKREERAQERERKVDEGFEKLLSIIEGHTTSGRSVEVFCMNDDLYHYHERDTDEPIEFEMAKDVLKIDVGENNWRENIVIEESILTIFHRSVAQPR